MHEATLKITYLSHLLQLCQSVMLKGYKNEFESIDYIWTSILFKLFQTCTGATHIFDCTAFGKFL